MTHIILQFYNTKKYNLCIFKHVQIDSLDNFFNLAHLCCMNLPYLKMFCLFKNIPILQLIVFRGKLNQPLSHLWLLQASQEVLRTSLKRECASNFSSNSLARNIRVYIEQRLMNYFRHIAFVSRVV